MNSSNPSECNDDNEIEYVGTVARDGSCENPIKNAHPYLKRSFNDSHSTTTKRSLADVKNDFNINCENLSSTDTDNTEYIGYSPPCTLSSIIILILMNSEHRSLTYSQLRDIICELFPHFEKNDLYKRMIQRIAVATKKNCQDNGSQLFLKNILDRQTNSTLVMLNPAEESNWRKYVLHEIVNNFKMKASMRKPELLPQLIQGLAKISITYEREIPIITIILNKNVCKSTATKETFSIYYSINEKEKEKQSKTLNIAKPIKGPASIGSSSCSAYDSDDSLPDLSDDSIESSFMKSFCKDSFESEQPIIIPTVKINKISQGNDMCSKIPTTSSQSNNREASTVDNLKLIERKNMERKLSKTINSRKELLHCPTSVLNEDNMLNIGLVRSNNVNNGNIEQEYSILTKEYSLESSNEGNKFHNKKAKILQDIPHCVSLWKKHFPWMQYVQEQKILICKTCNWLSCEKSQSEVYKIDSAQDVHCVASNLRMHSNVEFHIISSAKYEELAIQCKYQYIAIKDHLFELSSENEVINFVELTAERKLYTMQSIIPSNLSGMAITTRLLAEYIEDNLLLSLKGSPFFSVIALEEKGYAIVRWLDSSLDPVEHLLCSRLRFPDNDMSCLEYLERKQVDLSKLVSYSKYPSMKSEFKLPENLLHFEKTASPFRITTFSVCLEWFKNNTFLIKIYLEVSFICKTAKSMPYKFCRCPNAKMLANVKNSENFNIILEEEIMDIFFDNIKVLKDIARTIYTKTGSLEALGFSKSVFNYASIKSVIMILVDIDKFLKEDHPKLSMLNKIRIKLLNIEKYVQDNETENEEQYKLFVKQETRKEFHVVDKDLNSVIGVLDMYLSYVALALSSPSTDIVEDYQKYRSCSKSEDVESVLYLLDTNSLERLRPSMLEMRLLFNNQRGHVRTILDIIKKIKEQPTLQVELPLGWKLMQAVAVLPFLPAKREQNMFNVATGEFSIMAKEMPMLVPALLYIMLEGPKTEDLDEEIILSYWSNSWKNITQT